jgi:hypothetical protein
MSSAPSGTVTHDAAGGIVDGDQPVPYSDRRFTREYIAERTENHRWDVRQTHLCGFGVTA